MDGKDFFTWDNIFIHSLASVQRRRQRRQSLPDPQGRRVRTCWADDDVATGIGLRECLSLEKGNIRYPARREPFGHLALPIYIELDLVASQERLIPACPRLEGIPRIPSDFGQACEVTNHDAVSRLGEWNFEASKPRGGPGGGEFAEPFHTMSRVKRE
jgi:hypothetical protein